MLEQSILILKMKSISVKINPKNHLDVIYLDI